MKRSLEGTDNLVKGGGDAELLGLAGLDPPRGDLYAQKQVPVCLAPARSHSRKRGVSLFCTIKQKKNSGFNSTHIRKAGKTKKMGKWKEKKKNGHNCHGRIIREVVVLVRVIVMGGL